MQVASPAATPRVDESSPLRDAAVDGPEGPPSHSWSGREVQPTEAREENEEATPELEKPEAVKGRGERFFRWVNLSVKFLSISSMVFVLLVSLLGKPSMLITDDAAHRQVMSALFLVGLFLVAVEDVVKVDKSAVMLILSTTMWVFTAAYYHPTRSEEGRKEFHEHLEKGLTDVGSIILFLLPAMAVVESIDHFGGFNAVTFLIRRMLGGSKSRLMPIICILSFFMSSVIDNLTATIVALKILSNVAGGDADFRKLCGGLAVVAANAGGAWSPIGDVTTTMLWIQNKITVPKLVLGLFLPSLVAGVVPLAGLWWQATVQERARARDGTSKQGIEGAGADLPVTRTNIVVLVLGLVTILMVPLLKMWTGLPPYLGMLFALGIVWVVTESLELAAEAEREEKTPTVDIENASSEVSTSASESSKGKVGVAEALHKVDLTGLLFFAGVLMAVVALDAAGVLSHYAQWMKGAFGESPLILSSILGASSAVVDNVPLVEASIDMFENPTDDPLWQLVALAAGTGGSTLSIGSIAGVTLMSMEGVGFLWYLKRVSPWAALGFGLSLAVYDLQRRLLD